MRWGGGPWAWERPGWSPSSFPLVLSRIGPEWPNLALNPALLSIAGGVSGVIVGGYALARGGSRRLLWLVLIPGAVTVVLWLAFLVGEFVSPP